MGWCLPSTQMHAHTQLVSQEALGSRSVLHMADVFWACLLTRGDTVPPQMRNAGESGVGRRLPHSVIPGIPGREAWAGQCSLMGAGE